MAYGAYGLPAPASTTPPQHGGTEESLADLLARMPPPPKGPVSPSPEAQSSRPHQGDLGLLPHSLPASIFMLNSTFIHVPLTAVLPLQAPERLLLAVSPCWTAAAHQHPARIWVGVCSWCLQPLPFTELELMRACCSRCCMGGCEARRHAWSFC